MTSFARDSGGGYLNAIKSDDTVAEAGSDGSVTLSSGTWYIPFGSSFAPLPSEVDVVSGHLKWAAAVAGTITFEDCDFPAKRGGSGGGDYDVADNDATSGNWVPQNPPDAYVPVVGTNNSATLLVITAGGTHAGAAKVNLSGWGGRRGRFKLVLTVGGAVWCNVHGKGG